MSQSTRCDTMNAVATPLARSAFSNQGPPRMACPNWLVLRNVLCRLSAGLRRLLGFRSQGLGIILGTPWTFGVQPSSETWKWGGSKFRYVTGPCYALFGPLQQGAAVAKPPPHPLPCQNRTENWPKRTVEAVSTVCQLMKITLTTSKTTSPRSAASL